MTTCRDHITRAMREIRALSSGQTPTADELGDGLVLLQGLVDGLFGDSVGYPLTDEIVDADSDIVADTRCLVFTSSPSLSFPEDPVNGQRVAIKDMIGTAYPITIAATPDDVTVSTDSTFIYDGNSATWLLVSPLGADSELPISEDEFFRLELAAAFAPQFNAALSAESVERLKRARARTRARYEVSRDDSGAEFF